MKKTVISAGVISISVMMGMGSAIASMSPELKVQGQMAVPSCQLALQNGGVVDLGKISNSLINPTAKTPLKATSAGLVSVDCDAKTFLSFTVTDNREGTASESNSSYFGLGNVNENGKLGYFRLYIGNGLVDGKTSAFYSTAKGSTSIKPEVLVYADKQKVNGWAQGGSSVQQSGTKFSGLLIVEPFLGSAKDMGGPITDSVKFDGSVTLNFAYGL